MWDPYTEFESATLPNGLRVHHAHWPGRPWVAAEFLVRVGAEQDPVGQEGVSHLDEHLISENGPMSMRDMEAFFEDNGGSATFGRTSDYDTGYSFFAPSGGEVLLQAFTMFGQMLICNNLDKGIEQERQVVCEEFDRKFPSQFGLDLEMRVRRALYPGWWLTRGAGPIGTLRAVKSLTPEQLKVHYDAYYVPSNMEVVCVGGLSLGALLQLLERTPFAVSKMGNKVVIPQPVTSPQAPLEARYSYSREEEFPGSERLKTASYDSLAVLPGGESIGIRFLAGMLDEVLFDKLRLQKRWTYRVKCGWWNYRHFYRFNIDCDAFNPDALDLIEGVIDECIESLASRRELFEKARQRFLAALLMNDITGWKVCEIAISDLSVNGEIRTLAKQKERYEVFTWEQFLELLPWLRPQRRLTIIRRP
jgi:predicted Zn-dependent peptidase